jgi:hypothetical protein
LQHDTLARQVRAVAGLNVRMKGMPAAPSGFAEANVHAAARAGEKVFRK